MQKLFFQRRLKNCVHYLLIAAFASFQFFFSISSLHSVSANNLTVVNLPCNLNSGKTLHQINASRIHAHSTNQDKYKEFDLQPGDECANNEIKAAISGVIEVSRSGAFYCAQKNAYVQNTQIIITNNIGVKVTYFHHILNSQTATVADGQVNAGETIATIGAEGCTTGPHIHFEVSKNGIKLFSSNHANIAGSTGLWEFGNTGASTQIYRHHFGDINSDGKDDLIQISTKGGQGWVALADASGNFNLWSHTFFTGESNGVYRHHLSDVNGDGRDDLVQISIQGGQGWVALADASGNFNLWSHTFFTGESNGAYRHYLSDVNGDGRDDLVQISILGSQGWVALADTSGNFNLWSSTFFTGESNGAYRHYLSDVNGDGREDLVQISIQGGQGWVALADASGNFNLWTHTFFTGESNGVYRHHLSDINGDGLDDLIQISILGGQGWVALADASGNFNLWSSTFNTGEAGGLYRHHLNDVNGDGREDLVQISIQGGQGWVALADASGNFSLWSSTFNTGEAGGQYRHHLADANGDGKTDLIQFSRPGGSGWLGLADSNNTFIIWSSNIDTGEYGN